jgi:hypothetical protein
MSAYLHDGKPVGTFDIYQNEVAQLKKLDKELTGFGSHTHRYQFNPVLTLSEIEQYEEKLGVKLPAILKEFYLTVGNGGAGSGYGVYSMNNLIAIPEIYDIDNPDQEGFDEEDDGQWLVELGLPAKLLAVMDLGCGYYLCLEPGDDSGTMYSYDVTYDELCKPLNQTFVETLLEWVEESRQKISEKN